MSRSPVTIDQRRKPVAGFPSVVAACVALADAEQPPEVIAEIIGRDANYVRATLRHVRVPPRPRSYALPRPVAVALEEPAKARGLTPRELAVQLLDVIVRDDLFDALLGEPEASRG